MGSAPSMFLLTFHSHLLQSVLATLSALGPLHGCFLLPLHPWLLTLGSQLRGCPDPPKPNRPPLLPVHQFPAGLLFVTAFHLPVFSLLACLPVFTAFPPGERAPRAQSTPIWMLAGGRKEGWNELPSDLHRCQPRAWCCSCLNCRDSSWLGKDRQTQSLGRGAPQGAATGERWSSWGMECRGQGPRLGNGEEEAPLGGPLGTESLLQACAGLNRALILALPSEPPSPLVPLACPSTAQTGCLQTSRCLTPDHP